MSVAISIADRDTELPMITDTWLNTPELRINVDIHILFNDKVCDNHYYIYIYIL